MCDCVKRINAFHNIELHSGRWFLIKFKQQHKEKLKYAKTLRHFFQLMPDKNICRTHHSNVFTALYIKIDHFI